MEAIKINLEYAKTNKLFYFVANAVVYRKSDGRCLILKRSTNQKVHPNKYCVPGGKLEWEDLDINHPTRMNGDVYDFERAVENLLKREVLEEAGIEIEEQLKYLNSVAFIRPDGIPVILVKFAAIYKSGEVKVQEGEFTDFKWVNSPEIGAFDCILGIPEEIKATELLFK